MSIAAASDLEGAPTRHPLLPPLISVAGCAALADWFFFGWEIGVSVALFLGVLGCAAIACNRVRAPRKTQIITTAIFVAGLLAVIEDADILSAALGALATALFVIILTARKPWSWQGQLFEAATVPFRGPFQLAGDVFGALRHMSERTPSWVGWLIAWIVPSGIFVVFLALFASANPLIEYRLMQIDLRVLLNFLSFPRAAFWIVTACIIWPLIHRRIQRRPARESGQAVAAVAAEPSAPDHLLGEKAMLRSLILFNALFALQTGLDVTYLWGDASLPHGMSHAEYAHRGAYPLIVTALLGAGFVLVAMRPNGPAKQCRLIRPLVLLWTGQNILLVVSSIFRLDLYVAAFSLTCWRLAAFIWMGLVAAGLLLILMQIVLKKPISWLVTANAATLALVLYGCCFINAPFVVASYNIEHSREGGGTGPNLDLGYLASLGPQALPAIKALGKDVPGLWSIAWDDWHDFQTRMRPGNWRAWSFRAWRLARYLANNPDMPPDPPNGRQG
jgi:hypothetical protein